MHLDGERGAVVPAEAIRLVGDPPHHAEAVAGAAAAVQVG